MCQGVQPLHVLTGAYPGAQAVVAGCALLKNAALSRALRRKDVEMNQLFVMARPLLLLLVPSLCLPQAPVLPRSPHDALWSCVQRSAGLPQDCMQARICHAMYMCGIHTTYLPWQASTPCAYVHVLPSGSDALAGRAQVFKLQESLQGAARVPIVRHTSCAVSTTFPLEPASIISF